MDIYLKDIVMVALKPTLYNEVAIQANTEYKKYIGICRKFSLKARSGDCLFSYQEGQSNLVYELLKDGISHSEDNILTSEDFCIFWQSPSQNAVFEVTIWQ